MKTLARHQVRGGFEDAILARRIADTGRRLDVVRGLLADGSPPGFG
jgi:hypothetical protein